MEKLLLSANRFFEQIPDVSRRYRWQIWIAFILINIVILAGASRFTIDMTMEVFFEDGDPVKTAYDRFRAEFGSDEAIYLIYEANDGDVFSNDSLNALKGLQSDLVNYRDHLKDEQGSGLDRITDVISLLNVSYMEARDDALISGKFIGDNFPQNEEQREALRDKALRHPDYPTVYLSNDSRFGAVIIKTDLGATLLTDESALNENSGDVEYLDDEFVDELSLSEGEDIEMAWSDTDAKLALANNTDIPEFKRAEIEDFSYLMHAFSPIIEKSEYTQYLTFYPVGNPTVMSFFNDVVFQEMGTVVGASLLLIIISLWVLFRSLSAVLWPLTIVVISFLWVVGLVGWSGMIMTMMVNIIVFLILAVGVADAIHIISGYLFFREQGEDHEQSIRSVFKKSGLACFLTSITTSIGLLSLTFVPIVPIRSFGIAAAMGVMIAFLLTVFILPLMLDAWPPIRKKEIQRGDKISLIQRILRSVEHVGFTHPRKVISIFVLFAAVLIVGGLSVKVDSNMVEVLPPDSLLRKSFQLVDDEMGGSQTMEMVIDAGKADAFKDPEMLNRLQKIQLFLERTYPGLVGKTTSLVNVTKDAFKSLNNDDPAYYVIPQSPRVLEQTLFMFNNASPKDRRQLVSDDYSKARLTIRLKNAGSFEYVPMIQGAENEMARVLEDMKAKYPAIDVRLTGGMSLMIRLIDYVSWSQIQSFGLALVVISLLLLMVFGSVKIGLVAIFPNLLPIITVFGLMGYMGVSLDTDTLLIAPIIIGIAIDDTIHFLTHYRAGLIGSKTMEQSIRYTIREAGQAITFTSIVLSLGFLVFLLSSHVALQNFGMLSAVAIMVALITDLLLLPALCVVFKADFANHRREDATLAAESMG
ncbi:hypothetical protein A9Q99_06575 [Gammaproteobacteria bacterium 45_16_T64]|nr:hypothetical protein A9Q99_06575 [Gammaproteobacteria bacterium 45_16_T64]